MTFRDLKTNEKNRSRISVLMEGKSLVPHHSPSLILSWYTGTQHAEECKSGRIQIASTFVNLLGFLTK